MNANWHSKDQSSSFRLSWKRRQSDDVQLAPPRGRCGLGMGVTQRSDGALVVTAVQKHSPAESTGVHPGDEIESVDGVEVRGHPAAEVADLTCGFEGSKSMVTIRTRDGEVFERIMYRRLPDDDGVHSGNGVLPRIGILKALDRAVEDWFRSSSGGKPENDAASACEKSRRVAPYTFRTEDKGAHDWTPNGAEEKTNDAADAESILQILERSGATQATLYEVKKALSKTPLPASSCNVAHLPAHRGSSTLPTAAKEAVQSAAHAIGLSANDRSSSDGAKSGIGCALRRLGSGELALSNIEITSPCHNAGIEQGSVLLAVDGNAVSGLCGAQVAHLTQGPPGSDLVLTVRRPGGSVDSVRVRRLHHVQHYDRSRRMHPDSEPSEVSRLREPSRPASHRHRGVNRAAELAVGGGPRRSSGGDDVLPPASRGLVSSMWRDPSPVRQNVSFSASVAREEPAEMDSSQQARRASSPSEVHLGAEESMVSGAWWTRGWNWVADDTPGIAEHWLSKKESGAAALRSQVDGLRSWLNET